MPKRLTGTSRICGRKVAIAAAIVSVIIAVRVVAVVTIALAVVDVAKIVITMSQLFWGF